MEVDADRVDAVWTGELRWLVLVCLQVWDREGRGK